MRSHFTSINCTTVVFTVVLTLRLSDCKLCPGYKIQAIDIYKDKKIVATRL